MYSTNATITTGLGSGINYYIGDSVDNAISFGSTVIDTVNVTSGTESADFHLNLISNGTMTEVLRASYTGDISLYGSGQLMEISDFRMKKNITAPNPESSYNKIMQIQVKDYQYIKNDKKTHRGFIAQELKEIIPEAISIDYDSPFKDEIPDFHTIAHNELFGYLVQTIQFMDTKIKDLEKKINDLENK
jgi:hypothetical protein